MRIKVRLGINQYSSVQFGLCNIDQLLKVSIC